MPKVHFVKKARKDNSAVQKGESYYWWKFMYGPKRYSKSRPRPSQLTQSDKLSRYYEAQERVEDIDLDGDLSEIAEELRDIAESVREIGEEYQESADNILEYFEYSQTAEECEEKAYACEGTADSIENVADDVENLDPDTEDEEVESILQNIFWELA